MGSKYLLDVSLAKTNNIDLCSQPRQEEYSTRASVAFKQSYRNVEFENVNGDICAQDIDAIGSSL